MILDGMRPAAYAQKLAVKAATMKPGLQRARLLKAGAVQRLILSFITSLIGVCFGESNT